MNQSALPTLPLIRSVTDLRYKAREIMRAVHEEGKTVLLTKDNDPVAVLFPISLYNALRQYVQILEEAHGITKLEEKVKPRTVPRSGSGAGVSAKE